jgi:hypothetical protein
MWWAEDVARASVRRQGAGLSAGQVADRVAEASRRERETREALRGPAGSEPLGSDARHLAQVWAAKLTEWRRIAGLLTATGQPTYEPEQDEQGTAWERER